MKKIQSCLRESYCLFLKNNKRIATIATVILLSTVATYASPIGIGQKLPPIVITNIINGRNQTITSQDMAGKLVILDFWATWCGGCVNVMPLEDSLQAYFGDRIMIIPVTYQTGTEVTAFFKRAKRLQGFSLPVATSDTLLQNYFPHRLLPHYVWIDKYGTVKAFTGSAEINRGNISAMLSTTVVPLEQKKDVIVDYHPEIPLLFGQYGFVHPDVKFESFFGSYKPGLPTSYTIRRDSDKTINRITATNASFEMLAGLAWCDNRIQFTRNRTEIDQSIIGKARFVQGLSGDANDGWMQENSTCYELMTPPSMHNQSFEIMKQDLKRMYPQYEALVEKRKRECLVLVRTSNKDKIKSKSEKFRYDVDHFHIDFRYAYVTSFTSALRSALESLPTPVLDGTKYPGRIDISLTSDLTSLTEVRNSLREYDLDLINRIEEIEVLVIRKAKN